MTCVFFILNSVMNHLSSFSPVVILFAVTLLTIVNVYICHERPQRYDTRNLTEKQISGDAHSQDDGTIQYDCLSRNEMSDIVSTFPHLHVLSAAKAGSSSLGTIVHNCMSQVFKRDLIYGALYQGTDENMREKRSMILKDNLHPFPITVGPLKPLTFNKYADTLSPSNLVVYSHRQELSRLKSAIVYVTDHHFVGPKLGWWGLQKVPQIAHDLIEKHGSTITGNATHGFLDETLLIEVIKLHTYELGYDDSRMLSCDLYESIQTNQPNLVIIENKKIDDFQSVLAETICPDLKKPVHLLSHEKKPVNSYVVSSDGTTHTVSDWVDEKINILEWALNLRDEKRSCKGETWTMEETLSSCPTGFVRVVGSGRVR